jgi:hypothetical protein
VLFALLEIILFSWIFGITRGWKELNEGADMKTPIIFKYIIKYVTPVILLWVFIGSLPSIYDTLTHKTSKQEIYLSRHTEELDGIIVDNEDKIMADSTNKDSVRTWNLAISDAKAMLQKVSRKDFQSTEDKKILFKNLSRMLLMVLWIAIAVLIRIAYLKRKKEGRLNT